MKVLLLFITICTTSFNVHAQESKSDFKSDPYMDAMMKMGTPGPQHALLKEMVGSWTAVTRMWKDSTSTAMESVGTSENKLILGDRFLSQEFHGTHMDEPFTGMGMMGHDNMKKKFVSTWMDDMSTGIMVSNCTSDTGGKTITCMGEFQDPLTQKMMKTTMITRLESSNKHVFEMWRNDKMGKKFKGMEITYTKK